ncbi:MAG: T9SS type A sorting domain-containing protein [Ignavibacteriales bacterium]|nr:T9SS type A sorting domain-containing protein [Ignavibacteriales bacterium]
MIVAKGNSNVIYAGCSNGRVQVTTDARFNMEFEKQRIALQLIVLVLPLIQTILQQHLQLSQRFTSGSKVYKTTNSGVNWTNISGNLPNIPVNCIVISSSNVNNIVVGTDLGIFSTVNGGGSWVQDNGGLANVSVADLDYRTSDNKLFAATHGRSMYSTSFVTSVNEISSQIPNRFEVSQNYPNPFNPSTRFKYALPEGRNVKVVIYDLNGRRVAELVNDYQNAGTYEVTLEW